MAHCLVTGGAGFIGSHLVTELLRRGHQVRVLDDFNTGTQRNLTAVEAQLQAEGCTFSLETVQGSVLDAQHLSVVTAGIDYVFHQAALPSVAFSLQDPVRSHRVNVEGTLNVLVAARDHRVRRVIYAGSSSAYGDNPTLPKCEEHPPKPLSPYAVAKLTGEYYCRVFTGVYGLETIILRYFNVFGPRQNPASQYAAVIPRFISALLASRHLSVYGDGRQTRDFTYVDNVVHGNLLAMEAACIAGRVLNVATGGCISLLQLIAALEGLCQRRAQVDFLPPRAGDVRHSQADITRAKELLGYVPQVDVQQGLQRTLAYYQQHSA